MTRVAINDSIWALGLVLQCALVSMMFARGIARRLPVFTVLIVFYPLRSLVRFTVYSHFAAGTYSSIYAVVSLLDIVLQLAVATEIGVHLLRACWGSMRRMVAGGIFVLIPCLAWGATLLVCNMLPPEVPIPPDRLQMFASFTMIALCVWAHLRPIAHLLRRVATGFAIYGAFDIAGTAGRTMAAVHRDVRAYTEWAYLLSAVYLGVVVYWMIVLRRRHVRAHRASVRGTQTLRTAKA